MDNHDYDIANAEYVLMTAQSISGTAGHKAAARLAMFPIVLTELELAVAETKRLQGSYTASVQHALDQIQAIFRAEILEAINRYGGVVKAFDALHEKVKMKSYNDGPYLWQSIEDKGFSEAFDKLVAARIALELHNIPLTEA